MEQRTEELYYEKEEAEHFLAKIEWYWSQIVQAVVRKDIERVRECYFAIKALQKKIDISMY